MERNMSSSATNQKYHKNQREKLQHFKLDELSREEVEEKVRQLEVHNFQLRNLLAKSHAQEQATQFGELSADTTSCNDKASKKRSFDFSQHSKRHILLKLLYLGWEYQGFVMQENCINTVETVLLNALKRTKLIESFETANYNRCGRTDKGVSAFDQVVSLTVRSRLRKGLGVIPPKEYTGMPGETLLNESGPVLSETELKHEIDYVQLLNQVLPRGINVLAWCPVPEGYSSRFDCMSRTYKYFFPIGDLDLNLMSEGAEHLIGTHDFRNFCKMNLREGVVNFERTLHSFEICHVAMESHSKVKQLIEKWKNNELINTAEATDTENTDNPNITHASNVHFGENEEIVKETETEIAFNPIISQGNNVHFGENKESPYLTINDQNNSADGISGYQMCVATVRGRGFLYHQVRAMMSILFLVGQGKEKPSIIQQLLDIEANPRRPQYHLASDVALNLYSTEFEDIAWIWDQKSLIYTSKQLQKIWVQQACKTAMLQHMLLDLEGHFNEDKHKNDKGSQAFNKFQTTSLSGETQVKVHRPLLTRQKCDSLEERVDALIKRRKIDPSIMEKVALKLNVT